MHMLLLTAWQAACFRLATGLASHCCKTCLMISPPCMRGRSTTLARAGRGGGSGGGRGRARACLFDCAGFEGFNAATSRAVAHLAGSPDVYRSDNPADVRARVSVMGGVFDQSSCATCVNAAIAAAMTAAVATALRVDAATLSPLAHDAAYHCGYAHGEQGARRSCGTGWSFDEALRAMQLYPSAFAMNASCLNGADLTQLSATTAQLDAVCSSAKSACGVAGFKCTSAALSDGVWSIQRAIR